MTLAADYIAGEQLLAVDLNELIAQVIVNTADCLYTKNRIAEQTVTLGPGMTAADIVRIINAGGQPTAFYPAGQGSPVGVSQVIEVGTAYQMSAMEIPGADKIAILHGTKLVIAALDAAGVLTFGTPITGITANSSFDMCWDTTNSRLHVFWGGNGVSGCELDCYSISGTTLTLVKAKAVGGNSSSNYLRCCYHAALNRIVLFYTDGATSDGYGQCCQFVPGTPDYTLGTATRITALDTIAFCDIAYDSVLQKCVICYTNNNSDGMAACVNVTSGNAFLATGNYNTGVKFSTSTNDVGHTKIEFDPVNGKFLIVYWDSTATNVSKTIVCSISGGSLDTVSFGSEVTFDSTVLNSTIGFALAYSREMGCFCVYSMANASPYYGRICMIRIEGTVPIYETPLDITLKRQQAAGFGIGMAWNATRKRFVGVHADFTTLDPEGIVINPLDPGKANGILQETGTAGQQKKVTLDRGISLVHSGLTPGAEYYIDPLTLALSTTVGRYRAGICVPGATGLQVKFTDLGMKFISSSSGSTTSGSTITVPASAEFVVIDMSTPPLSGALECRNEVFLLKNGKLTGIIKEWGNSLGISTTVTWSGNTLTFVTSTAGAMQNAPTAYFYR